MYIVDAAGILVHKGGIDLIPSADTSDIPKAKQYVRVALAEVLAGKQVAEASTRPYGCNLKYWPQPLEGLGSRTRRSLAQRTSGKCGKPEHLPAEICAGKKSQRTSEPVDGVAPASGKNGVIPSVARDP
jgi:hypothetical protein